MITLIHGTDIVSSRKIFLDEKQKYPDSLLVDGEKVTLTDLTQIFEGGGLFAETKTVFIEQLFTRKKSRKAASSPSKSLSEFEILTQYLEKQSTHTIFLWEGKELEKSTLNALKTATARVFKLPQTLFVLLDSLKPGNGKVLLSLFHQTIASTEVEMVFFMLIRQVRLLLALTPPVILGKAKNLEDPSAKLQDDNIIDELKRLAPWQKTKLEQQAKLFGREKLIILYQKLFELESGQKTGTLPNKNLTMIDFLLLEI